MYEFWIKNDIKNNHLLLPVTPSSYEVSYGNTIETIAATNIGDINIPTYRRLMTINLEGIFTVKKSNYTNQLKYTSKTINYVNLIKGWINSKDIVRLIIASKDETKLNSEFYIEDITYSEDSTSNGDINYRITFREFNAKMRREVM